MDHRSAEFGRLLKAGIMSIAILEGKNVPIVEDELGQQMGRGFAAIERWKAGHIPPDFTAIKILAEACVRRGLLGRAWLERFLRAARYPEANTLLNQLCPIDPTRPRPPRVYHNLPAPTYNQFVMRPQSYTEAIDGLQQRSAVVLMSLFAL